MKESIVGERAVSKPMRRRVLTAAVAAALGLGLTEGAAQALTVVSWDLRDFDSDGLGSDFAFFAAPTGSSVNRFGLADEDCGSGPGSCVPVAFDAGLIATNIFTTGFNFGGTGTFAPNVFGNISATVDFAPTGNSATEGSRLGFAALDFGGLFPSDGAAEAFDLPPDIMANCTGAAGCGTEGFGYSVETFTDLGGGDFGVVVRYVSTVPGIKISFPANWRIEGVMSTSTVPVPAAAATPPRARGLAAAGIRVPRRLPVAPRDTLDRDDGRHGPGTPRRGAGRRRARRRDPRPA